MKFQNLILIFISLEINVSYSKVDHWLFGLRVLPEIWIFSFCAFGKRPRNSIWLEIIMKRQSCEQPPKGSDKKNNLYCCHTGTSQTMGNGIFVRKKIVHLKLYHSRRKLQPEINFHSWWDIYEDKPKQPMANDKRRLNIFAPMSFYVHCKFEWTFANEWQYSIFEVVGKITDKKFRHNAINHLVEWQQKIIIKIMKSSAEKSIFSVFFFLYQFRY